MSITCPVGRLQWSTSIYNEFLVHNWLQLVWNLWCFKPIYNCCTHHKISHGSRNRLMGTENPSLVWTTTRLKCKAKEQYTSCPWLLQLWKPSLCCLYNPSAPFSPSSYPKSKHGWECLWNLSLSTVPLTTPTKILSVSQFDKISYVSTPPKY